MSGYPPPTRPYDSGSPVRSPEREDRGGYSRGSFSSSRHADPPPHFDAPRGFEGTPDRPWDSRREYDDRWADDYDRKRRRSPSPSYSHQRARYRSPSPPRARGPHPLPDPASLDYLLTFKQFAEWFRASHPQTARDDDEDLRRIRSEVEKGVLPESVLVEKHGMAKRYERYRKEYHSRQLFTIYLTHRDEAWFQERYSPDSDAVALRSRVNRQGRVPSVQQYVSELKDGKWDAVNYDQNDEFNKIPDHEPEGLDRALGEEAFDPLRLEVPPRPGQVFVKTVPPSTRRVDLERVFGKHPGFQWLALSEPSAKRAFHRVGWAQYEEGVKVEEVVNTIDGSKVDGFTFHMGVNATPIVGRIRVAPAVSGSLQRLEADSARAREIALKLEEELLEESSPPPEAEAEVVKAEGEGEGEAEGEGEGEGEASEPKAEPPKDTTPRLRERGSEAVDDVIARILARDGLDGDELDDEQRTRKAKITLDQYLAYLRHGLNTCYYCVVPTAFPEELQRKCVGHLRAKIEEAPPVEENGDDEERAEKEKPEAEQEGNDASEPREGENREQRETAAGQQANPKRYTFPSKSNDERWLDNLDLKVRSLIEDDSDVVEYGGRDLEDETKRLTAPCIKQEDADKYRCKQCTKLFRAPEYVIKHIISKHPEVVKEKLDELAVFNAFAIDPQHLQPSSTTPASVDDQLPLTPATLPAFNPSKASQAMFNAAAASQPGFNMAMQQQMMMMMHMQMMMHGGSGSGPGGASGSPSTSKGQTRDFDSDGLPPPPPGAEDPRARKGRLSYHDLDEPGGGGGGGLPY